MRVLPVSLTILLLAGCSPPPEAPAVNQPGEAVVEAELQNEQDAVDDDITNDAAADARNETADDNDTDDSDTPDRFSCDKGLVVQVDYGADDGTARLTAGGKTLALLASGDTYTTNDGLTPGQSLTWAAKGTTATLTQTPHGTGKGSPMPTVAHCEAID